MIHSGYRALWRVFVPTWRFFDRVDARARVFVEFDGRWREALVRPPRRWFAVLFNPAANLHHADQNLVERLLAEVAEGHPPADLTSYRLLRRRLDPGVVPWRFKIARAGDDHLRSPWYEGEA